MAAMFRRPRPGGGGHPPALAPTVSSFKPRAQWNDSGSSVFLYVNVPGFYIDQIKINKDERTRRIQIQGERRLSSHTKTRFSEAYRVPDSCDMSKMTTSFSHGLLSIEFPRVVEGQKPEKVVQDNQEGSSNGTNLGRKKPLDEENQLGTSKEKASPPMAKVEEPKTYKSVLEGNKAVPKGNSRERYEEKMKGEASPSLGRKQRVKEDKVVERTDIGHEKNGEKVKEITKTSGDGRLDPNVHGKAEKVTERNGDGKIGQKLGEEAKTGLGQRKTEKYTKPIFEDEARRREKERAAINRVEPEVKTKERVERIARDVNGNGKSKNDKKDEKMVGETQEKVKEKKVDGTGLVKETRDVKDNPEVTEPEWVSSDDPTKEELTRVGEVREKMAEKSLESESGSLLAEEGQKKTDMDHLAVGESQKYDTTLVNVGVAALVIMGFGAYVFVPLVKLFIN